MGFWMLVLATIIGGVLTAVVLSFAGPMLAPKASSSGSSVPYYLAKP